MDILIEIIVDIYGEIVFGMIPEEGLTKRARRLLKLLAAAVFLGMVALTAVGSYYLFEERRLIGLLPIGIALTLLIAHIVLFFFAKRRK